MDDPGALVRTHARLQSGEPIRILIGERLVEATEIVPMPNLATVLRRFLLRDLARQIADLTPPEPASPAPAIPAQPETAAC